ncbi:hypothetical protein CALCODRAFT_485983 [Calocera cornea HHB12733]|uniref:Uncharacterized protein n=1 Tax=Calocera cornea HHB12733 TaxID=1353952 RepID=A0A165E139_9BASI|nr:hypothetical protein CALCODRAFT_485983 [Calocera cornea HHB12733]
MSDFQLGPSALSLLHRLPLRCTFESFNYALPTAPFNTAFMPTSLAVFCRTAYTLIRAFWTREHHDANFCYALASIVQGGANVHTPYTLRIWDEVMIIQILILVVDAIEDAYLYPDFPWTAVGDTDQYPSMLNLHAGYLQTRPLVADESIFKDLEQIAREWAYTFNYGILCAGPEGLQSPSSVHWQSMIEASGSLAYLYTLQLGPDGHLYRKFRGELHHLLPEWAAAKIFVTLGLSPVALLEVQDPAYGKRYSSAHADSELKKIQRLDLKNMMQLVCQYGPQLQVQRNDNLAMRHVENQILHMVGNFFQEQLTGKTEQQLRLLLDIHLWMLYLDWQAVKLRVNGNVSQGFRQPWTSSIYARAET